MITVKLDDASKWLRTQKKFAIAAQLMPLVVKNVMRKEAEWFRTKIVEGLRNQAPAGRKFRVKLNPWTEATRKFMGVGGTKSLIVNGDLMRSIAVYEVGQDLMVGPRPGSVSSSGMSMVKIATMQEEGFGPIWIKLSPKMVKYIAMIAKRLKEDPPDKKVARRKGWIRVDIPARPFIRPIFSKWGWAGAREYRGRVYLAELGKLLGW